MGDEQGFIMRIEDLSHLVVEGKVAEVDRLKLKKGQEAQIRLLSRADLKITGMITELGLATLEQEQGWMRNASQNLLTLFRSRMWSR